MKLLNGYFHYKGFHRFLLNVTKEVVSSDTTSFVFSGFVIVFRQLQKIEMSNQFSYNDILVFLNTSLLKGNYGCQSTKPLYSAYKFI
ncbi:hypothetical protein FHR29_004212 [Sphingobacterium sp. JUb56]|nr:hypothetical protein [Sphingobacterium sp. JUb56]